MGKEMIQRESIDLFSCAFSNEEKEFIKNVVAPGQDLTDPELLLYAYVCKRRGLDPFLKQVIPVKYQDNKTGKKNLSFITSIDAYRAIAQRTGQYGGSSDYLFDEGLNEYEFLSRWQEKLAREGKILEIDKILIHPHTATSKVYKIMNQHKIETVATARWIEYYPGGERGFFWNKMPFLKLGICAEALGLRKAFPFDLSGLYVDAEMEKPTQAVYNFENNEDLVRQVEEGYSILGWNKARQLQYTLEHCGTDDINMATRPALEGLIEMLHKEIDRMEVQR